MQRSKPLFLLTLIVGLNQNVLPENRRPVAQQPAQVNSRGTSRVAGEMVPFRTNSSTNPSVRPKPIPSSSSILNSSTSTSSSECSNANVNTNDLAQVHSLTERFRCIQCDSECDPYCETLQQVDVYPFAKIEVPIIPCSTYCVKLTSNRNRSSMTCSRIILSVT